MKGFLGSLPLVGRLDNAVRLPNYSNYAILPNEGKVWSFNQGKLIGRKHPTRGYWFVSLAGDDGKVWNTSLHRISWIAVNGEIPEGYQVNHKDENKDNNSISNLNLLTPKENSNWGTKSVRLSHSISKPLLGLKNGKPSILFTSQIEAKSRGFGSVSSYINDNRTYKGYNWVYVEDYLGINTKSNL